MKDTIKGNGLRLMLYLSGKPLDAAEVEYIEWEAPVERYSRYIVLPAQFNLLIRALET